jgi:hypothetical protein
VLYCRVKKCHRALLPAEEGPSCFIAGWRRAVVLYCRLEKGRRALLQPAEKVPSRFIAGGKEPSATLVWGKDKIALSLSHLLHRTCDYRRRLFSGPPAPKLESLSAINSSVKVNLPRANSGVSWHSFDDFMKLRQSFVSIRGSWISVFVVFDLSQRSYFLW